MHACNVCVCVCICRLEENLEKPIVSYHVDSGDQTQKLLGLVASAFPI